MLVSLNDVVIFSEAPKEHIKHTKLVLRLLKDAGVTFHLKNCTFLTGQIHYSSHVINSEKLEVAKHKAVAIRKLQIPTTVTKLRSSLIPCNVFRIFLPNFARIESLLSKCFCKSQDKELGPLTKEELTALETRKEKFISLPVITGPNNNGRCALNTDACVRKVGCVLLQKCNNGTKKPIGYCLITLKDR